MVTVNDDQLVSLKRVYDLIKDNPNFEQEAYHIKQIIHILESQNN
jgi:hypothetical protein